MAQVNKTVYPDVDASNSNFTTTLTLSGSNFTDYLVPGLEKSITYTMSTNPKAPYNSTRCCDMRSNAWSRNTLETTQVQRLALKDGSAQDIGSDRCGTVSWLNTQWDANFTTSMRLFSAFKWNALCGRLMCEWYKDPTGTDFTDPNSWYFGTWKDFKDLIRSNDGHHYVLTSAWVSDVWGGAVTGTKPYGVRCIDLYKKFVAYWDWDNDWAEVDGDAFIYANMRPMMQFHTAYNQASSLSSNGPDNCWPVYNYGYGIASYSNDAMTWDYNSAVLIFGVDDSISDTKYRLYGTQWEPWHVSTNSATYGISVDDFGVENLIDYIEEKAATLGILTYTDVKDPYAHRAYDTSTVANIFSRDIICPITDEDGYFNGDFITSSDDLPGTSAEWMIQGDKDSVFDDGPGTIDPEPEPPASAIEYIFAGEEFKLTFDIKPTSNAPIHNPFEPSPLGFDDDNMRYYYTPKADPVIRFTSPVDGNEYSVQVKDLEEFNSFTVLQSGAAFWNDQPNMTVYSLLPLDDPSYNNYYISYIAPYIMGTAGLNGIYSESQMMGASFSEMQVFNNSAKQYWKTSLGSLVRYFQNLNPDFTSEDVYTVLYMDFYEYDEDEETRILATRALDYSSLYGSGIDATKYGDGDSDSSWTSLPGHENDDTKEELNPPLTSRINLNNPELSPYNLFNRTFIFNANNVEDLSNLISTIDDTTLQAVLDGLKMFGANPMAALIDLRLYPFDVAKVEYPSGTALATELILGRYSTGIIAPVLDGDHCAIPLGSIFIKPKYNSFLDYEPYTTIRLYIPYIGTIELAPSIYMDRTVSVNLIVDYITGAATAVIFANGIPMTYQSGIIGNSIAMTGDNASEYSNSVLGNLVGAIGSAAGAVAKAATGNIGEAVSAVKDAATDLFKMGESLNDVKFQQAGSASPASSNWLPQKCHIMIARPDPIFSKGSDEVVYGLNVGYATAYTSTIGSLDGNGIYYGVLPRHVGAYSSEPVPTEKEMEMIKTALNRGFYIN